MNPDSTYYQNRHGNIPIYRTICLESSIWIEEEKCKQIPSVFCAPRHFIPGYNALSYNIFIKEQCRLILRPPTLIANEETSFKLYWKLGSSFSFRSFWRDCFWHLFMDLITCFDKYFICFKRKQKINTRCPASSVHRKIKPLSMLYDLSEMNWYSRQSNDFKLVDYIHLVSLHQNDWFLL